MNLFKECNSNEKELLNKLDLSVEDMEYSKEELRRYENNIEEYIMSKSSKNGDIAKSINEYSSILDKIVINK